MIRKQTGRTIRRGSAAFFRVALAGVNHDMRVPNMVRLAEFVALVAGRADLPKDAPAAQVIRHRAEGMRLVGAALGLCWYSTSHVLEAPVSDDLLAYGLDVWEELHEAGIDRTEISAAGDAAFDAIMAAIRTPSMMDVEERATFSKATGEP